MVLAFLVAFPMIGALISWIIGWHNERTRDYFADIVTILEFLLVTLLVLNQAGGDASVLSSDVNGICGLGLHFTMDGFRALYAWIASLMWMMTTILSREYFQHHENRNRFYLFLLLTLGATQGVFLSADLYTTFIFFEMMSFTSYVWVAQEETAEALRAASTYLAVAITGGLVMLMGIFLLYHYLGTLEIAKLQAAAAAFEQKEILYAAGACILFGFGAKAGAFPLHIWLPKAHPVAPAPASALLSGILTKTGIYGILAISCTIFLRDTSWGILILAVGVLTMFGGALLAIFSIDLKRTLACSSMSQIGFILIGVGMQGLLGKENALAVHGTLLHMINHSLIKLVLFMAAGVIYMNAHSLNLNQIRGYGRKKPLLKMIFLTGALAIGGIPLFGGYISKTLLHESIVEFGGPWIMKAVEYIFLVSGGLTIAYMTKLFVAIFVEENEDTELQKKYDIEKSYMNRESTFALAGSALILFIWGILPQFTMDRAAAFGQGFMQLEEYGEKISYFSWENLSGALISLIIGALVYLLIIRRLLMKKAAGKTLYLDRWPVWLDLENMLYRPLLCTILPAISGFFCRILDSLLDALVIALRKTIYRESSIPVERVEGTAFTEWIGHILNALLPYIHKNQQGKDYVHETALYHKYRKESYQIIFRSLSFGLMLCCIGLALTVIYMLWF